MDTFFMFGFLLAILAVVYLYFELRNTREKFRNLQKDDARKIFELAVLNDFLEKIGYSLSSKDIAATIAHTAGKLFQVSAVSYAIVESDALELTTISHEKVGPHYLEGVKDIVLQGMYAIDESLREKPVTHKVKEIHEVDQKDLLLDNLIHSDTRPPSYFNIPLVLNNRFTGMINITSKIPHTYQDEDMSMLYKIVNRAQLAIGRLEDVIESEKGKVESLVKSLSSGEIFFTLVKNKEGDRDSLNLFTINGAARRFLHLGSDDPDIMHVLGSFDLKPNLVSEMKDVIVKKKSTIYRDVEIGELSFNIYLTPVFSRDYEKVIGVALTMQDVTRENETQKIREGFTNMMIHELRAPLTAIKGAAELLSQEASAEEDKIKMRLVIKNAAERLLQEIDDLLDRAKIDAGRMVMEKTEANINEVIEKTVQELSYAAQDRAILIENHLDTSLPQFTFDTVRIGQVVTNLLSNAIKYSEPHTIIEVFTRHLSREVEIEVRDHGQGIDEEKIGALFKPFSQVNLFKKAHGTGLGLYITKAIVEAHGGKIRLSSEEGKGTSVFVELPMSKDLPEEIGERPQSYVN